MPLSSLSFAQRADPATLPEWMDQPCSYEDFRACLKDLEQVNRLTLAYRPTMAWLSKVLPTQTSAPLRIVDIGCGGGDMLRHVAALARKRGVAVSLTGIDLNPHAIRAAQEFTPASANIEYLCRNAYTYAPAGGIDIILSSLMTHHLSEPAIVEFLSWMKGTAQRGWFVNDLRRSHFAYRLFRALSVTMRWHRFVQHDGPVSIRRSFREADWQSLCAATGVPDATIRRRFPFRLCVGATR